MKFHLFLLSSSLIVTSAQISIHPDGDNYVTTLGADAIFACFSSSGVAIKNITWLLNDTALSTNTDNVTRVEESNQISSLHLTNIPIDYNNTMFQCTAVIAETGTHAITEFRLLLLQGRLAAVGGLIIEAQENTVCLTWTAPFSLDLTDAPEIEEYCVEVLNTTSSQNFTAMCGISDTEFCYSMPDDDVCHRYITSVVAVNAAGIGAKTSVVLPLTHNAPADILMVDVRLQETTQTRTRLLYSLIMSAPVCSGVLTFVDLNTGERKLFENSFLNITQNNVTFTDEQLKVNRRYSIEAIMSNVGGSPTSHTLISTHDIMDAAIIQNLNGSIVLTTVYSEYSTASGALFSFVFTTDSGDVDFSRSFLLALDRNTSHNHTLPFDLHPGHYRVYVYDIEYNRTLHNGVGYPAVTVIHPHFRPIDRDLDVPTLSNDENCQINSTVGAITIHCPDSVADLIQVIAQKESGAEKLYTGQSTDIHTPVTISVEDIGTYMVSVFAIRDSIGIVGSTNVLFTKQVMVSNTTTASTTFTMVTASTTSSTHEGTTSMSRESSDKILNFLKPLLITLCVCITAIIALVILAVICYSKKRKECTTHCADSKSPWTTNLQNNEVTHQRRGGSVIYSTKPKLQGQEENETNWTTNPSFDSPGGCEGSMPSGAYVEPDSDMPPLTVSGAQVNPVY